MTTEAATPRAASISVKIAQREDGVEWNEDQQHDGKRHMQQEPAVQQPVQPLLQVVLLPLVDEFFQGVDGVEEAGVSAAHGGERAGRGRAG